MQHIFTSYKTINHITDLSSSSSTLPIIFGHFYPFETPGIWKLSISKTKLRSPPQAGSSSSSSDTHIRLVTRAQSLKRSLESSPAPLHLIRGQVLFFFEIFLSPALVSPFLLLPTSFRPWWHYTGRLQGHAAGAYSSLLEPILHSPARLSFSLLPPQHSPGLEPSTLSVRGAQFCFFFFL